MRILEVRKNGELMCTYIDELSFPDKETIKCLKAAGYKLYQDGKLYQPETTKRNTKNK